MHSPPRNYKYIIIINQKILNPSSEKPLKTNETQNIFFSFMHYIDDCAVI